MGYFISSFRGAEYLLHSLNMVFLDVHIKQSTSIQIICIINNLETTEEKRRYRTDIGIGRYSKLQYRYRYRTWKSWIEPSLIPDCTTDKHPPPPSNSKKKKNRSSAAWDGNFKGGGLCFNTGGCDQYILLLEGQSHHYYHHFKSKICFSEWFEWCFHCM